MSVAYQIFLTSTIVRMSCRCYLPNGQKEAVCGKVKDGDLITCPLSECGNCSPLPHQYRVIDVPVLYMIMLILVIISTIVSILEA